MKIAIIISLLSAFQIHHQTIVNVFSSMNISGVKELSDYDLILIGGSFPLGKFIGTYITKLICEKYSLLCCIDVNSICLLIGSIVSLFPSIIFLVIGRFIIGFGVGIGFIISSTVMYDYYSYDKRITSFFVSAIFFSGAALYSNFIITGTYTSSYFITVFFINLPSIISGLLYFKNRELFIDRMCYSLEKTTPCERELLTMSFYRISPMFIAYILMALNAFITVPIIMAYSTVIFESIGIIPTRAKQISIFYPLIQLTILSGFRLKDNAISRKKLIIGGYSIGLILFFCFLLSIQGIEQDLTLATHNPLIAAVLFLIFAVIIAIPCNTAFCFITELFSSRETQIEALSKSRMVLWILSTIETSSFYPILKQTNLFASLLPYFTISTVLFLIVLMAFLTTTIGDDEDERIKLKIDEQYDYLNTTDINNENNNTEELYYDQYDENDCSL